jgi:hypothetical protein
MTNSDDDFYDDVDDGDGCAEIWEKLSERRKKSGEQEAQS